MPSTAIAVSCPYCQRPTALQETHGSLTFACESSDCLMDCWTLRLDRVLAQAKLPKRKAR